MRDHDTPVKATATSFTVLETIQSEGSAGVSELARKVDLSKSAVYKHVTTLSELGYLVRKNEKYHLSLRFLMMGMQARNHLPLDIIETVVTDLAETTGYTTNFIAREDDRGFYAIREEADSNGYKHLFEGAIAPLHATAGGKAILAMLDKDEREKILRESDLKAFTDKTITEPAVLEQELQSIRDKRVALDREEFQENTQSVASPVVAGESTPIGAISVTGSDQHLSGKRLKEDIAGHVASAAKRVEKSIRTT